MTNKCTIISQIITLLHVSALSCHHQGACDQYIVKLHKYFKCSCWKRMFFFFFWCCSPTRAMVSSFTRFL